MSDVLLLFSITNNRMTASCPQSSTRCIKLLLAPTNCSHIAFFSQRNMVGL